MGFEIGVIIVFAIFALIFLFYAVSERDYFALVAGIISTIVIFEVIWFNGYRVGQVDTLTGHKPLYELITKPDSTKTWEYRP